MVCVRVCVRSQVGLTRDFYDITLWPAEELTHMTPPALAAAQRGKGLTLGAKLPAATPATSTPHNSVQPQPQLHAEPTEPACSQKTSQAVSEGTSEGATAADMIARGSAFVQAPALPSCTLQQVALAAQAAAHRTADHGNIQTTVVGLQRQYSTVQGGSKEGFCRSGDSCVGASAVQWSTSELQALLTLRERLSALVAMEQGAAKGRT